MYKRYLLAVIFCSDCRSIPLTSLSLSSPRKSLKDLILHSLTMRVAHLVYLASSVVIFVNASPVPSRENATAIAVRGIVAGETTGGSLPSAGQNIEPTSAKRDVEILAARDGKDLPTGIVVATPPSKTARSVQTLVARASKAGHVGSGTKPAKTARSFQTLAARGKIVAGKGAPPAKTVVARASKAVPVGGGTKPAKTARSVQTLAARDPKAPPSLGIQRRDSNGNAETSDSTVSSPSGSGENENAEARRDVHIQARGSGNAETTSSTTTSPSGSSENGGAVARDVQILAARDGSNSDAETTGSSTIPPSSGSGQNSDAVARDVQVLAARVPAGSDPAGTPVSKQGRDVISVAVSNDPSPTAASGPTVTIADIVSLTNGDPMDPTAAPGKR